MVCALTFDDGPSQWTAPILDLLAEHEAHATFFLTGQRILGNEKLLYRMQDEGHEIGNHTWTHRHLPTLTDAEIWRELVDTAQEIADCTRGELQILHWRAPYLDVDERVTRIGRQAGAFHVGADVIPGDWNCGDAQEIAQRVLSNLSDGEVVLLHDGIPPDGGSGTKTRKPTVSAVALLLDTPDVSWCKVSDL